MSRFTRHFVAWTATAVAVLLVAIYLVPPDDERTVLGFALGVAAALGAAVSSRER